MAALIILFKYLTNFPEKLEEKESQEEREPPKPRKHIVGWMRRRKKKIRKLHGYVQNVPSAYYSLC